MIRRAHVLSIVFVICGTHGLRGQCVIPDTVRADVGVTVSTTNLRASAPGHAIATGDGSTCRDYIVSTGFTGDQLCNERIRSWRICSDARRACADRKLLFVIDQWFVHGHL